MEYSRRNRPGWRRPVNPIEPGVQKPDALLFCAAGGPSTTGGTPAFTVIVKSQFPVCERKQTPGMGLVVLTSTGGPPAGIEGVGMSSDAGGVPTGTTYATRVTDPPAGPVP